MDNSVDTSTRRAVLALSAIQELQWPSVGLWRRSNPGWKSIPKTTEQRCNQSWSDQSRDIFPVKALKVNGSTIDNEEGEKPETVLYLAYGSNLSSETFLGRRGIRPLSAINVAVPSLRLTFDLPGIPYIEPCFANSGKRDPDSDLAPIPLFSTSSTTLTEKTPLLSSPVDTPDYHKDKWHKPLVGVVYEVTLSDFAHIIATEGGGSSYQDILIACHPLDPASDTVPTHPTSTPLLAHTLYAPPISTPPPGSPPPTQPGNGGRFARPDPSYAQPSARYLNLITTGATEHNLPLEYRTFLSTIRPYTISTAAQRLGLFIFVSIFAPIFSFVIGTGSLFQNDKGRSPGWWVQLTTAIFVGVWAAYDGFFRGVFGDGERSVEDGGKRADDDKAEEVVEKGTVEGWLDRERIGSGRRWLMGKGGQVDEEKRVRDMC